MFGLRRSRPRASNLPLHALGQLGNNEPVAQVAEVEHELLRQVGVEVHRDPRAPVGVVAGQDRVRPLGTQLQDAVGIALEREQVTPGLGNLGVGRDRELAGKLPATHPVHHPAPLLVKRLGGAGEREQALVDIRKVHGGPQSGKRIALPKATRQK